MPIARNGTTVLSINHRCEAGKLREPSESHPFCGAFFIRSILVVVNHLVGFDICGSIKGITLGVRRMANDSQLFQSHSFIELSEVKSHCTSLSVARDQNLPADEHIAVPFFYRSQNERAKRLLRELAEMLAPMA